MALLVFLVPLSALQHSAAQDINDVESGLKGLIDIRTNVRNILNFGKSAISDLVQLDFRGITETMRDFPDNAGQTSGVYLLWIYSILSLILSFIPIINVFWILPSIILSIPIYFISGYFVYSNSAGLLHYTGLAQMIGAIPVLNLILLPLLIIIPILQPLLIALGRGGTGADEIIIDRFVTLTAPEEILEGEEFMVLATLDGEPLPDASITLENETVITDIYGVATLKAPEVVEDIGHIIYSSGEIWGATDILVRNSPGVFEFGWNEGDSSIVNVIILIVVLLALLGGLVLFSRKRRNS